MLKIRTTKTASSSTAVQVVRYEGRRIIIVKHIGSAKMKEDILLLKKAASDFIETYTGQQRLPELQPTSPKSTILQLDKCEYLGARHSFIYEVLGSILQRLGFDKTFDKLLLDIVLMRIITPASKLETITLLKELFGINWDETALYRSLPHYALLKERVENTVTTFAKKQYAFDFSIVFYDVTTLYFESFTQDQDMVDEKGIITKGIRRNGFSKDNKSNQPQIVIGLIVTKEGFPVSYDIFEGNTFEGKTFIPTITKFKDTHAVKTLTVVADAAMISLENIEALVKSNLSYIVGARTANLKIDQIKTINRELNSIDASSTRIETPRGLLVCDFSLKRYKKDKREMEKQIMKAENLIKEHKALTRTKFIKTDKANQILNTDLIEKTKLLLGIKGYYTNLVDETNETIIRHYHNLWHVEKAFRIAKSDLATRPIYHFKRQAIEAHILTCFMSLAVCKYMELKTGQSTRKIVKQLKSITDASIRNLLTDEIIVMRQTIPETIERLWKTLIKS